MAYGPPKAIECIVFGTYALNMRVYFDPLGTVSNEGARTGTFILHESQKAPPPSFQKSLNEGVYLQE